MTRKKTDSKAVQKLNVSEMEQEAGQGIESATSECFALAYLTILQDLSPQVKKKNDLYIKGAEAGMILNTATGEIFDGEKGIEVIPFAFEQTINIWGPNRGGFKGRMSPSDPRYAKSIPGTGKDEFKRFDGDGNELADTRNHFIFIIHKDGRLDPVVMSCSHSKIKISGKWLNLIRGIRHDGKQGKFNPPSYAYSYKLTTALETNNDGKEYFNWSIPKKDRFVFDDAPEIYLESRVSHKQYAEGRIEAETPALVGDGESKDDY